MSERDRQRARDRERERERDRDRDRDRERRRDKEDRERDRDPERTRSKRSRSRTRTPDRNRSRHTRSRTRSPDHRSHRRNHQHHRGSLSPSPPTKRHRRDHDDEKGHQKAVADFVDGIAKEQLEKKENNSGGFGEGIEGGGDEDEIERMEKLGIPVRFDSTKGKPVPGADVSGVRAVTKRQPRQYMNRRGGFNRPLEAERNR